MDKIIVVKYDFTNSLGKTSRCDQLLSGDQRLVDISRIEEVNAVYVG
jgi:hypothetical protein